MEKVRGVYEHPKNSGVWWICYFENGRRHREKVGRRHVAIAAYQKRKMEILEGKFFPVARRQIRFDEIATDTLEYSKRQHSAAHRRNVASRIKDLLKQFGGRPAEKITPLDVERFLLRLSAEGLKASTVNRYHALLSLIYTLALRNEKVISHPVRQVRQLRENNGRTRFLKEPEEVALRDAIRKDCPERLPELDLALNTGMRLGEQYGLTWPDVEIERRMLTLRKTKNGDARYLPLNDMAVAALKDLQECSSALGRKTVCLSRSPRAWFNACIKGAKLEDFHWHDLRHTFASRLVMAGVELRTIQELLGHKTIAMTVRYTHLSEAHKLQAVGKLVAGDGPAPVVQPRPFVVPAASK
jgi:site-specific recombinase XerD